MSSSLPRPSSYDVWVQMSNEVGALPDAPTREIGVRVESIRDLLREYMDRRDDEATR